MTNLNHKFNLTTATQYTNTVSMTSQEIAELVQVRHDNVKRTVDTLVESGVIACPQIEEVQKMINNRSYTSEVYVFSGDQGKRDAMVLVAQLSPLFTGKLVDRWMELERQISQPKLPTTFKEALLALVQAEDEKEQLLLQTQQQAVQIVELEEKTDALDIIASKKGTVTLGEAAKFLKIRLKDLTTWLLRNGWMAGNGSANYKPYATAAQNGWLHYTFSSNGYSQTRITYKGIAAIARKMAKQLRTEDFN